MNPPGEGSREPANEPNPAEADAAAGPGAADAADAGMGQPKPGPAPRATSGGEVRRLARAPGERYQTAAVASTPAAPGRAKRFGFGLAAALGTAIVTFALITVDIGPGLLVLGLAGGWITGLAVAGGARAGTGGDAGSKRAAIAAVLAAGGIAGGLLLDALRAYAVGGVLLPWEYALARFGWMAPVAIVLAAIAGAIRGR